MPKQKTPVKRIRKNITLDTVVYEGCDDIYNLSEFFNSCLISHIKKHNPDYYKRHIHNRYYAKLPEGTKIFIKEGNQLRLPRRDELENFIHCGIVPDGQQFEDDYNKKDSNQIDTRTCIFIQKGDERFAVDPKYLVKVNEEIM